MFFFDLLEWLAEKLEPPDPPEEMQYCPSCGGTGFDKWWQPCRNCGTTGYVPVEKKGGLQH